MLSLLATLPLQARAVVRVTGDDALRDAPPRPSVDAVEDRRVKDTVKARLFGKRSEQLRIGRFVVLKRIGALMSERKDRAVIQRTYPITEIAAAHAESASGHVRGKIAIAVA